MPWCNDPYEPECVGYTCPRWGVCEASKQSMQEDSTVRDEWKEYQVKNYIQKLEDYVALIERERDKKPHALEIAEKLEEQTSGDYELLNQAVECLWDDYYLLRQMAIWIKVALKHGFKKKQRIRLCGNSAKK